MGTRKRLSIVIAMIVVALPFQADVAGKTASSAPITDEELRAGIADRAAFGLPADGAYVLSLMTSASDVGTAEWGIPLTADEMARLDLLRRGEFQTASHSVLAFARSSPGFAGAYFDQRADGELVLQFTGTTDWIKQRVAELAPEGGIQTRVETVGHSFAQLQGAMFSATGAVQKVAPSAVLVSVGILEPRNGIVVTILADETGPQLAAELTDQLAVPVQVEFADSLLTPGSCPSRSQTCTPEEGGVWAGTSVEGCTMGFHVVRGSDRQFVTAGHCSDQPSESKTWYQPYPNYPGAIYLGPQRAQLYTNATNTIDVQRVEMPDNQASKLIFGEGTRQVSSSDVPYTGEVVCASLGHSNTVDCGTVKYAVGQYLLEGWYRVGTDTNGIVTGGGDSGAPLYWRGASTLVALGVYSAGQIGGENVDRWWARVEEAFLLWDYQWSIYH